MPIMLTRKDGPPTPFRNAEYIPFYYFIPKSILSHCGAELNAIPRNPQELFHNRAACEFVESDLFRYLPKAQMISTDTLGMAFEPEEYFETPEGEKIVFDTDLYGAERSDTPVAGPIGP